MATYYVELNGGELSPKTTLKGGGLVPSVSFTGAVIYPGSGGGGANLETKSVSYTPSETAISDTLLPDPGYDGFDEVDVTVDAIPDTYVGSAIPLRDSTDLSTSGATVTIPNGYYEFNASRTIPNASTPYLSSAEITNTGALNVDAELDYGGYLPAGTLPISLANAVTVKGAQTFTPGTTDQTISADQYLTGAQTIQGDADLVAGNIKKDVEIFGVTGTYEGGGGSDETLSKLLSKSLTEIEASVSGTVHYVENTFARQTQLTQISLPNLTQIGSSSNDNGSNFLRYGTHLTQIYMPKLARMYGAYIFGGCTALVNIALPSLIYGYGQHHFDGCTHLENVDFGKSNATPSNGLEQYMFVGCSSLKALVLRYQSVRALNNVNSFNNSAFASSGSGGTLYVPASLVSSYQAASNWSTILGYANNQIKSIESTHEDPDAPIDLTLYYVDGSPIS